jgi:hypothetical protein
MAYRSAGATSKRKYANVSNEDTGDADPVSTTIDSLVYDTKFALECH